MFKRKGGRGGQRPFEQCSKKLHFFETSASLSFHWVFELQPRNMDKEGGSLDFVSELVPEVMTRQLGRLRGGCTCSEAGP